MNRQQTHFFTLAAQEIDGFFNGFTAGTHSNNQTICFRIAVVIKQMILTTGDFIYFLHVSFYQFRNRFIEAVGNFTLLEIDVRVLSSTANDRMIRVQRIATERFNSFKVGYLRHIFVIDKLDFLNLMGSTETVKEMNERNATFQSGQMSHQAQIHGLLHAVGSQHSKTGLTSSHYVLMIAENIQRVSCQRTRANMENGRQQFAGNFIHIRDHQEQALRRRISGRQSASLQRTMHRTSGASFRLHFYYANRLTEKIFLSLSSPLIHMLRHRRRRSDWENRSYFGKSIRYVRRCSVAIHCLHFLH